jgi:hypothetical protein
MVPAVQPTRHHERQRRRFKSAAQMQRFESVHGLGQNLLQGPGSGTVGSSPLLRKGACQVFQQIIDNATFPQNSLEIRDLHNGGEGGIRAKSRRAKASRAMPYKPARAEDRTK